MKQLHSRSQFAREPTPDEGKKVTSPGWKDGLQNWGLFVIDGPTKRNALLRSVTLES